MSKRYQYSTDIYYRSGSMRLEEQLNDWAIDGWRLHTIRLDDDNDAHLIFEREIESDESETEAQTPTA